VSILREVQVPGVTGLWPIGRGRFSSVYRGYQDGQDRLVAVKVLHADDPDVTALERFGRACEAMNRLSGRPYVVTIHHSGVLADGRPYLVCELCERGSLAVLLRAGPVPARRVVDIGRKTAEALREAHEAGIVHGQVKPANVLLRASGDPAVADFGMVARPESDDSFGLLHVAPERFVEDIPARATDVYSLGSTLYELLTGRPPYPRQPREGPLAHIGRVLSEPVAPVRDRAVPVDLARLLMEMLAGQPDDRPSIGDVVRRLESVQAGARSGPMSPESSRQATRRGSTAPGSAQVAGMRISRGRAASLAAIAAAAAVLLGALGLGLGGSEPLPCRPVAGSQGQADPACR
jgi:serine/threonine protein kinase